MNAPFNLNPRAPRRPLSDLERAHHRCIAELLVLRPPRRISGNADRFDILARADYVEAFVSGVTVYVSAVIDDICRQFPIGFIENETPRLTEAKDNIVGALKNAVDRMIDGEAA
jgi:hypothetical protein